MPDGHVDYWNHIAVDPEVRFGKPCIAGTRIAVSDILEKMSYGMTEEDILSEWDYLTPDSDQILSSVRIQRPPGHGLAVPNHPA